MSPLRLTALAVLLCASAIRADDLRALPPGQVPNDVRLQPQKDLDGYFPFEVPATVDAWKARADKVRFQMQVALGLYPMPTKTPLNAVIHGKIDRDDYTIEKVYFESMPGFFVTGNLYRPKTGGKHPGVLCPYGHWSNGRFTNNADPVAKKLIADGAEKFEAGSHSALQARCVQLARMGCVAFHYDMLGMADSVQIPATIVHGFKTQRPEMNTPENWGLFSPQAESHLQSIMGLQTWNSIRSLDFITSLEDVDSTRLAVTGASGGGTQTLMVSALDPRLTVSLPAVMTSTAMQGGCTCENASLLRIGTGNVEFASLFAPKPLAVTIAQDWTKEMKTKGFPEMEKLWALVGAPDKVHLIDTLKFGHNYNAVARAGMSEFFNQHLGLNIPPEKLAERDFTLSTIPEMSVWDDAHPAPAGGPEFERKLLKQWHADVQKQIAAKKEEIESRGWEVILGRTWANAGAASYEVKQKVDKGDHWLITAPVRNDTYHEEIPAVFLHPKTWNGSTVLWLSEQGKAGLFTGDKPKPEVAKLLAAGVSVIGIDLLYQGEFLKDGTPLPRTPKVANPREAAAFTLGYNEPVFAQRVHDILTVRKFIETDKHQAKKFGIVATDATAPLAAAARFLAGDRVQATLIGLSNFSFQNVPDIGDFSLLPGASRYGDFAGLRELGKSPLFVTALSNETQPGAVEKFLEALKP
ncbi:MAG TPA: acetylxylan esterase [Chthoniobacteraceae bacterium]|jgi:hypothetical protein|nr:acetylxylan esterase [Chthoniobacteraceae bacterium]